jgi:hypothetical protein
MEAVKIINCFEKNPALALTTVSLSLGRMKDLI